MDIQKPEPTLEQLSEAIKAVRAAGKTELDSVIAALSASIEDSSQLSIKQINELKSELTKLQHKQLKLDETDAKQSEQIIELSATDRAVAVQFDKLTHQVDDIQCRLDGNRSPQVKESNLETIRIQGEQTANKLAGIGGQLSYEEIQGGAQRFKFLGTAGNWILGTFGVGIVGIIATSVFGFSKAPDLTPTINAQANEIKILKKELDILKEFVDDTKKSTSSDVEKLEKRVDKLADRPAK